MSIKDGVVDAIGNTPLIRLKHASAATGCTILSKAEFMNPGQSVKDRAALFIIRDALERGVLRPGPSSSTRGAPGVPVAPGVPLASGAVAAGAGRWRPSAGAAAAGDERRCRGAA